VVVKGITWVPLLELAAWGLIAWVTARKRPDWSPGKRLTAGGLSSLIIFGSEWCHNLAHAAVAHHIGKPADAILIFWGTPLLIYYDINDQQVSPSHHILRATGGPLFNALMVPLTLLARRATRDGTLGRYCADLAVGANGFIAAMALLPIPGIDGGPILKWSLVKGGRSPQEADEVVKKVNLVVGSGLERQPVGFSKRRKWIGRFGRYIAGDWDGIFKGINRTGDSIQRISSC
jgi:Zn-dependent protease